HTVRRSRRACRGRFGNWNEAGSPTRSRLSRREPRNSSSQTAQPMTFRIPPLAAAVGSVLVCGIIHGFYTQRWAPSSELNDAAARIDRVAMTIGDWQGESLEVSAHQLEASEAANYFSREYVNRTTGSNVSVILISGLPGPVSVHTPDICFQG